MPTLPDNPSLDRFRRAARDLQRAVRVGDPDALAQVGRHHPRGAPDDPGAFPLTAAHLVVARRCGFESWPALRRYLDAAAPVRRSMPLAGDGEALAAADELCALACLVYSPLDEPARWSRAADLLRRQPDVAATSVWAAAAAGDVSAVRGHLDADPGAARAEGGPHRWTPLTYLAYSRLGVADPARAVGAVDCATALLDAGADPDDGYLWRGMPTPFTVLTGVFGGGEQGVARQPPHPAAGALAELLLHRGANPNDAQTLYNRMFTPADDHLVLLLRHGLGRGDGGPWGRRLGSVLDPPAELLRQQLAWAIAHRYAGRVALLVARGAVDVQAPLPDWPCRALAGLSPVAAAWRAGSREIAEILQGAGAAAAPPDRHQVAIGELLAGRELPAGMAADPTSVAALRESCPALIHRADHPGAVRAVVDAGFEVNARRDGGTALHWAAWRGDVALVQALLAAGADPSAISDQHRTTALGWAEHARQPGTAKILVPVTPSAAG